MGSTSSRSGYCEVKEFNGDTLSNTLVEAAKFIRKIEAESRLHYITVHAERHQEAHHHTEETYEWYEVSVFYQYYLGAWEGEHAEMREELLG